MNRLTPDVIDALAAAEPVANEMRRSSTEWSLTSAVAEVTSLWASTSRSLDTARDGLYNFLGATYEHALRVAADEGSLRDLRNQVRLAYTSKKQAACIVSASPDALLLLAALGVRQGSLRSKYRALLDKAAHEQVPRDRESFKVWLRSSGGVVKALRDAMSAASVKPQGTAGARAVDNDAIIRGLLLTRTVTGMLPIHMIGNKPPSDAFHVVVYRSEGNALVPCYETDQTKVVREVLRLVASLIEAPVSTDVANVPPPVSPTSPTNIGADLNPALALRKVA